jgi:hypothetical protein
MPKTTASRRVGRPSTRPKAGQKATLNVRASPALKRRLQAAADRADRSLSAEMELRLEASFLGEELRGDERARALIESMATAAVAKFGPGWAGDWRSYWKVTDPRGGLWAEHLVRWRPVVTEGVPPVARRVSEPAADQPPVDVTGQPADVPAQHAGSAPPEHELMDQLLHLVEQLNRLVAQMQAVTWSRTEQPAPDTAGSGEDEGVERGIA